MLAVQSDGFRAGQHEPMRMYLWHLSQGGLGPYWEHLARLRGLGLGRHPSAPVLVEHPSQPQMARIQRMLQCALADGPVAHTCWTTRSARISVW